MDMKKRIPLALGIALCAATLATGCGGISDSQEATLGRQLIAMSRGEVHTPFADDVEAATPWGTAQTAGGAATLLLRHPLQELVAADAHHDVIRIAALDDDHHPIHLWVQTRDDQVVTMVAFDGGGGENTAVLQAYQRAWTEVDADLRSEALEASFAEDGRYVDPNTEASGRAALEDAIVDFQSLPGASIVPDGIVDDHHGWVLFKWRMHMGPAPVLDGFDVVRVGDDGRLDEVYGFFAPL